MYYYIIFSALISFLSVSFFFAPVIHEYSHISVLNLYGCEYDFSFKFGVEAGIYAVINTSCPLSLYQSVILLSAGVIGTFLLGISFILGGWLSRRNFLISIIFTCTGLGFLTDPVFYMFADKGDLINVMKLLGFSETWILPLLGIVFTIAVFIYVWIYMEDALKFYYRVSEEIERLKELYYEFHEHYLHAMKKFSPGKHNFIWKKRKK